jgi:hypothetical protein
MTNKCIEKCFNYSKPSQNNTCNDICYHKYVNVLSKVEQLNREQGKVKHSELVIKAYNLNFDIWDKFFFPSGGTEIMTPLIPFRFIDQLRVFPSEGANFLKNPDEWR